jgi:FkbM family methyltransferase
VIYFEEGGWYLPDGEEHLQQYMNTVKHREKSNGESRLTYQYNKYAACLPYVRRRRVAVDIGAHVGLWSWVMARDFNELYAFEPMPAHQECWLKNMRKADADIHLLNHVLGDKEGSVRVSTRTPGSSGDTGISPEGVEVFMRTLDSFNLQNVDFIKLDCEGYELFALRGAVETLKSNRPCLIVEQKAKVTGMEEKYGVTVKECLDFLMSLGARQRGVIKEDYIFSW